MAKQKGSAGVERVTTGIPGLDPLIEGGLPKGTAVLVTGSAGTGKTIFGLQYLVEGARKGEKGVYINFDEQKEQLFAQAMCFGWDLEKLEADGLIKVLNFDMTKTHVVNVIVELENFMKKMEPKRLVLDSISILGIYSQVSAGAELSQLLGIRSDNMGNMSMDDIVSRGSIMGLIGKIRGFGATSLIISELPEQSQWLSRDTVSEFVCDGVIVLVKNTALNKRGLRIEKMRGTEHELSSVDFTINGKGVNVKEKS
ncbi:Circadian clock protein kinase KaiC [Candidatus Burarchaeum australiense]|nr:Circadian clock protein kinase KaiC [Candidatus Burarchaeum australiense]